MSFTEQARLWAEQAQKNLKRQPRERLIVAGLILACVIYALFSGRFSNATEREIDREIALAKTLCEASSEWVMANPERLKMGKNNLREFKINGEPLSFKYVQFPEVLFLDTGVYLISGHKREDLYCTFPDPRTRAAHFYFDYERRVWVDNVRFRN